MQPHRLHEAWDDEDDWNGVASSAERRKRQNRLNQRASRKKKHLQRCAAAASSLNSGSNVGCEAEPDSGEGTSIEIPSQSGPHDAHHANSLEWMVALRSMTRHNAIEFKRRIYLYRSLQLQAPRNIQDLVRMNVLNALASNAVALSIPFLDLDRDEVVSPFNLQGPRPAGAPSFPFSAPDILRPTALQIAVVHHPWIDVFPIPGVRDNILRGLDAGLLNEDELCADLFAADDGDGALAALVVWGEPWDARSWEISPQFLRKWGGLLQGCQDVLEATNFWRQKRGQRRINFIAD